MYFLFFHFCLSIFNKLHPLFSSNSNQTLSWANPSCIKTIKLFFCRYVSDQCNPHSLHVFIKTCIHIAPTEILWKSALHVFFFCIIDCFLIPHISFVPFLFCYSCSSDFWWSSSEVAAFLCKQLFVERADGVMSLTAREKQLVVRHQNRNWSVLWPCGATSINAWKISAAKSKYQY